MFSLTLSQWVPTTSSAVSYIFFCFLLFVFFFFCGNVDTAPANILAAACTAPHPSQLAHPYGMLAMSFGALIRVISGYHLDSTGIMCLAIVTTLIQNLLNIHRMQYLAFLNQSNVVWSCAALLFTVLVMAIKSPHWNSLEWLVDTYENRTGFESTTYVFMLGMIGAAYSLFGKLRPWGKNLENNSR